MTVKKKYTEKDTLFYTTFTCHQWHSYIQLSHAWDLVYKGFDDMKRLYGVLVTGYVIMPNHVHSLLYVPEKSPDINQLIADQKRFLSYGIVDSLETQRNYRLLDQMRNDLIEAERTKGQLHKVFKGLPDIKECYSEWFIRQKLDYMHHNPVSGIWNLVEDFTLYPHSSASFYERNEAGIYEVTHYRDVWDSLVK